MLSGKINFKYAFSENYRDVFLMKICPLFSLFWFITWSQIFQILNDFKQLNLRQEFMLEYIELHI